jgi:hypothetical protein
MRAGLEQDQILGPDAKTGANTPRGAHVVLKYGRKLASAGLIPINMAAAEKD